MWIDIILGIVTSIGEAIFCNLLDKNKIKKYNKKLSKICEKNLNLFANTSLDSDTFYKFIKSDKFILMLRNYYYTINSDEIDKSLYISNICSFTLAECPNVNIEEIKKFYSEIDELFCTELRKIVESNVELNALLVILMRANKNILHEISGGYENLMKYLESESKKNCAEIDDEIIIQFHNNCNKDFSTINFSGIAGAETKKGSVLKDLYVENQFFVYSKDYSSIFNNEEDNCSHISISDFFNLSKKIVILGGAGFGKTTSLNYLYCNYETIFNYTALKIKINLKDYSTQIGLNGKSILDCLCNEFEKRVTYGNSAKYDIKSVISKYLENGECLIILDALDEIDSQNLRDKVRNEVANFCNVYYLNKVIITSREIGYLRNSFDDSFLHIKISLFTDEQIMEYVNKWVNINNKTIKFTDFYKEFWEEVVKSRCNEIIRNPIILVLSLIIFDSERKLPHKRVEFYRKCIETFLLSRENHKQAFNLDDKTKNILADTMLIPKIAYYKFKKQLDISEYTFSKQELIEAIFEALEVPDRINWNSSVETFFKYLTERAELIKENDENKYDFAHKTFSEYFLALYYSKNISFEKLIELLDKWIGDSNFDELARLVIEVIIDKNDSEQHKNLINYLFSNIDNYADCLQKSQSRESYNLYLRKCDAYLDIVLNLYKCGMMIPKFQDSYHKLLFKYPMVLKKVCRRRFFVNGHIDCYDKNTIFSLLNDSIQNNEENIKSHITILYYFKEVFNNDKVITNSLLSRICRDLKYIFAKKDSSLSNSVSDSDNNELINYYLVDNFNYVSCSAEIFLMILKIEDDMNKININKMIQFDIESNELFTEFINAEKLLKIIEKSFDNSEWFLFVIYTLLKCGKYRFRYLINYALERSIGSFRFKKFNENFDQVIIDKITINSKNLNNIFQNSKSIDMFIEELKMYNVYNQSFEYYYKKLFELFLNYELSSFEENNNEIL